MTTIIQHNTTGQYLCATGEWAAEESQALAFDSSLAALTHLFEKGIRDVVLVMRFSDPQYNIRLCPFLENRNEKGVPARDIQGEDYRDNRGVQGRSRSR